MKRRISQRSAVPDQANSWALDGRLVVDLFNPGARRAQLSEIETKKLRIIQVAQALSVRQGTVSELNPEHEHTLEIRIDDDLATELLSYAIGPSSDAKSRWDALEVWQTSAVTFGLRELLRVDPRRRTMSSDNRAADESFIAECKLLFQSVVNREPLEFIKITKLAEQIEEAKESDNG